MAMVSVPIRGKRLTVLGASGFIGQNLCRALVGAGALVKGCRRSAASGPVEGVDWIRADLADPTSFADAVADAEIVVHVAGRVSPVSSTQQRAQDIAENLAGSVQVLDLCIQAGVKRFIFASSGGTVYGLRAASPASEDDPTQPMSSYGIVKLAFERYLELYRRMHGLDAVSLRIGNIYGRGQKSGQQGLVARAIERAIAGEPIEIRGDGSAVRDYVHIDDVIAAFLRAATVNPMSDAPRIYNIGSGTGRSVREVIAAVEAVHRRPVAAVYLPAMPWDVPHIVLDVSRASRFLGWTPQRSWDAGVRDAYDWMQQELARA